MIGPAHNPVLETAMRGEAALQRAWRDLCEQAARDGRSLVVWRNNRVEHVDAAELLAEVDAQVDARRNGDCGE